LLEGRLGLLSVVVSQQQMIQRASTALVDDVVDVTVPADGGRLGILRTATAGMAARLGFPGDKIEDLRIAVDEACAMLLVLTKPDGDLHCRFEISVEVLTVAISATIRSGSRLPDPSSFGWRVLSGLTSQAWTEQEGDVATIKLACARPASNQDSSSAKDAIGGR
jgi:serine/threonine-protein kinase RsbW